VGNRVAVTDTLGFVTRYEYDALDRLIRETDPGGTTAYAYDPLGNRTVVTDALGNVTRYGYDALGHLVVVTDALGNVTRYTYDEVGNRRTWTDRLGHTMEHVYDAAGRVVERIDAEGNSTFYTYDPVGNIIAVTDPLGNVTCYGYDALGRLVVITDALGVRAFEYEYDAVGNRVAEIDALGNRTEYEYDALGRLTAERDPLGNTTRYAYDPLGHITVVTDANGYTTIYERDALGRVVTQTDRVGAVTTYEYDAAGNVVRVTDPLGSSTEFTYDYAGRILTILTEMGRRTEYEYDALGHLIRRTDPKGQVTEFQYDPLGRRIKALYPDGSGYSYTYDAEGRLLAAVTEEGGGGMKAADSDSTAMFYTYDSLGRLIAHTADYGSFTKTVEYTYDAVGNLVAADNPDWGVIRYAYDAAGRLITVTAPLSYNNALEDVIAFRYDAAGRRTGVAHISEDDWQTSIKYDAAGRVTTACLKTLAHWIDGSPTTTTITYTYDYDGEGRTTLKRYQYQYHKDLGDGETVTETRTEGREYDGAGRPLGIHTHLVGTRLERDRHMDLYIYTTTAILTATYNPVGDPVVAFYTGENAGTLFRNGEIVFQYYHTRTHTTTHAYDADHYRTAAVIDDGEVITTVAYSRDLNGALVQVTTGAERTLFSYDYENRLKTATLIKEGDMLRGPEVITDIYRARLSPEGYRLAEWRGRGVDLECEWRYLVSQFTGTAGWFLHNYSHNAWSENLGWAKFLYEAGLNARWGDFTVYRYAPLVNYRNFAYYALDVSYDGPVVTYIFPGGMAPLEGMDAEGNPVTFENPGFSSGFAPQSGFHPEYILDDGRGATALIKSQYYTTYPYNPPRRPSKAGKRPLTPLTSWFSGVGEAVDLFTDPFYHSWGTSTYLFEPGEGCYDPLYTIYNVDPWYTHEYEYGSYEEITIVDPPIIDTSYVKVGIEPPPPPPCARSNLESVINDLLDGLVDDIVDEFIDSFTGDVIEGLTSKVVEKVVAKAVGKKGAKAGKELIDEFVGMALEATGIADEAADMVKKHLMTKGMRNTIGRAAENTVRNALNKFLNDEVKRIIGRKCWPESALRNLLIQKARDFVAGKAGDLGSKLAEDLVNNKGVDKAIEKAVDKLMKKAAKKLAKKIIKTLAKKVGTKFIPVVGQIIAAWDLGQEIGGFLREIPLNSQNLGEAIDNYILDTYGEGISQFVEDAEEAGGGVVGYVKTYAKYWWEGVKSWFGWW